MVSGALISSSSGINSQAASCFVTTTSGHIQGQDLGASCAFLGIPFAAPPVGNLRWKPPQQAAAWAPATLNATTNPPPCPNVNPPGSTTTTGNEDCLKLNIWTPNPAPSAPAPVLVWIHTGAFQAASANLPDSNGRRMAEQTGAIVVAANYRVGPFGFMGHRALTIENPGYRSSGNYGFLDQRAAFAWVRDHIAAFGGDPNKVAIGGQSAGGHSVSLHLVSPGSAGLFHRAIAQSGTASTRWPMLADAEALGDRLAVKLGCTDPSQVLACLRSKTRAEVLLAFPNGQQEFAQTPRVAWGPVVDGLDIPDQPRRLYEMGAFNRVPAHHRKHQRRRVDLRGPQLSDRPDGRAVSDSRGGRVRGYQCACDPGAVPGYRLRFAEAGIVAPYRRRGDGLRSAQGRPTRRANRDARLPVFVRA
jgi:para-nitrobenzyl esterase